MNSNGMIEIGRCPETAFETVACGGDWKVSILNEAAIFLPGKLSYVERHTETDECFVLLEGKARIFIAGNGDVPDGKYNVIEMKPLTAYNIKENVWHALENEKGTKVLVIEKTDTGDENTIRIKYSFPSFKIDHQKS